jgi:hypothetical protein
MKSPKLSFLKTLYNKLYITNHKSHSYTIRHFLTKINYLFFTFYFFRKRFIFIITISFVKNSSNKNQNEIYTIKFIIKVDSFISQPVTIISPHSHNINNDNNNNGSNNHIHIVEQSHSQSQYDLVDSNYAFATINPSALIQVSSVIAPTGNHSQANLGGYNIIAVNQNQSNEHLHHDSSSQPSPSPLNSHQLTMDPRLLYTSNNPHLNESSTINQQIQQSHMFPDNEIKLITIQQQQHYNNNNNSHSSNLLPQSQNMSINNNSNNNNNNNTGVLIMNTNSTTASYLIPILTNPNQEIINNNNNINNNTHSVTTPSPMSSSSLSSSSPSTSNSPIYRTNSMTGEFLPLCFQ